MRHRKPTLRQLEYFVAVSDDRHYRRAAERLHVRQPTITNQISALEDNLECRLLERSRSGVNLTPLGREVLPRARAILEAVADLQRTAQPANAEAAGTYSMGVAPTLGPYFLPEIIPTVHRRYPSLKLYVRERVPAQLESDLLEGQQDLIITPTPISNQALTTVPLFHEPLFLAVSQEHPLASRKNVKASDLRGEKMLILENRHQLHRQVHDLADAIGAQLQTNYEGTSLDTLRQMVAMGMGVAMLPSLYVRSEIAQREDPEVKVLQIDNKNIQRTISVSWRNASPNRSFYRSLTHLLRELSVEIFEKHINLVD